MVAGEVEAKCGFCSLGLQPQELCMEVLVAQVFRVILLLIICNLSTNSMTQSCTDAPIEASFKAENIFINRSDRNVLVRTMCMQITFGVPPGALGKHRRSIHMIADSIPRTTNPRSLKMCDT